MRIAQIYLKNIGPLTDHHLDLWDSWRGVVHSRILFTGNNGCGKSTLLRAIVALWAVSCWQLDPRASLQQKQSVEAWLQRFGGIAIIFDKLDRITDTPFGLCFGDEDWIRTIQRDCLTDITGDVEWFGESKTNTESKCGLLPSLKELLNKVDPSHRDGINMPNIILCDYGILEIKANCRQIEASLINMATTQPAKLQEVLDYINLFFINKDLALDAGTNDNGACIKVKCRNGESHTLDELSHGELIGLSLIYTIDQQLQPGDILLVDDLHPHPSWSDVLLANIERLVAAKQGQLIITSHNTRIWERYDRSGLRIDLTPPSYAPAV